MLDSVMGTTPVSKGWLRWTLCNWAIRARFPALLWHLSSTGPTSCACCRSVDDVKVRLDFECPTTLQSKGTESKCSANGGTCVSVHDGFYIVSYSAIVVGVVLMFAFRNLLPKLSALPTESWRDKTRSM